jgi:hypothetical protein
MADAAKGAAGAYSALAGIPIVGPVLGAAAAGVTFAAIAAYEGLASAEGGMLTVPSDNFLINAHKNEMMLPAYIASPMRSFFEDGIQPNTQALGGGSASVASGGGDIHIVQTINVTAIDGASVVAHANKFAPIYAKAVSTQFQRSLSTRGKY